jgi:Domain of unknown function (DUF4386)
MNASVIDSQLASSQPGNTSTMDRAHSTWKPLYRVAGGAALLSVACIVAAIVVFLAWPPPTTIAGWFALFHRNAFLGLLDLDLLLVTSYVVLIPLYLALYVALRRVSQSFMAIALAFNMLGAALILGVNPGAAMLTLSDRYIAATSDAQRTTILAAGQALITNWSGSAFVVGYLLSGIAILITAAVMLRSGIFSKVIAYTGLVMGALMLVPASTGTVGLLLSLVSLAPTVIWLLLIARRLFQLAALQEADLEVISA